MPASEARFRQRLDTSEIKKPVGCGTRMAAANGTLLLYAEDTGKVCTTEDGGVTWKVVTPTLDVEARPPVTDIYLVRPGLRGVTERRFPSDLFLADTGYSYRNFYFTSTDGLTWSAKSTPISNCSGNSAMNFDIAKASTKWVNLNTTCRLTSTGQVYALATSDDGDNWKYTAVVPQLPGGGTGPVATMSSVAGAGSAVDAMYMNFYVKPGEDVVIIPGAIRDAGTYREGLLQVLF